MNNIYTREDMKEEKRSSWWEGWILGLVMGAGTVLLLAISLGAYLEIYYPL